MVLGNLAEWRICLGGTFVGECTKGSRLESKCDGSAFRRVQKETKEKLRGSGDLDFHSRSSVEYT